MKKEYSLLIKFGIYAVIIIAIAYFVYPLIGSYFAAQQVNVNPETAKSKLAACDISIYNPLGVPFLKNGDLIIQSANCQQTYVNFCGSRFGVFSDTGNLRLYGVGGVGESKDVKVYEGSSETYTLKWCGAVTTNSLTVSLYNDVGGKLYDREVKLP